MVSWSFDVCVQNMWLLLGGKERAQINNGVWTVHAKVWVCNCKRVECGWTGWGRGKGHGFRQRAEEGKDVVKMGHRLINDASSMITHPTMFDESSGLLVWQ